QFDACDDDEHDRDGQAEPAWREQCAEHGAEHALEVSPRPCPQLKRRHHRPEECFMPRTRVLLTGATGYVAAQLLPDLRERYDLRLVDTRDVDAHGEPVDGVEIVDLLETDEQT